MKFTEPVFLRRRQEIKLFCWSFISLKVISLKENLTVQFGFDDFFLQLLSSPENNLQVQFSARQTENYFKIIIFHFKIFVMNHFWRAVAFFYNFLCVYILKVKRSIIFIFFSLSTLKIFFHFTTFSLSIIVSSDANRDKKIHDQVWRRIGKRNLNISAREDDDENMPSRKRL